MTRCCLPPAVIFSAVCDKNVTLGLFWTRLSPVCKVLNKDTFHFQNPNMENQRKAIGNKTNYAFVHWCI